MLPYEAEVPVGLGSGWNQDPVASGGDALKPERQISISEVGLGDGEGVE